MPSVSDSLILNGLVLLTHTFTHILSSLVYKTNSAIVCSLLIRCQEFFVTKNCLYRHPAYKIANLYPQAHLNYAPIIKLGFEYTFRYSKHFFLLLKISS